MKHHSPPPRSKAKTQHTFHIYNVVKAYENNSRCSKKLNYCIDTNMHTKHNSKSTLLEQCDSQKKKKKTFFIFDIK